MAYFVPYDVVRVTVVGSRSRFRRWVGRYGHSRLARSLGTSRVLVHSWTAGTKPRNIEIKTVREMIALSRLEPLVDGPLTYDDILGEVAIAERTTHTYAPKPPACVRRRIGGR